MFSEQFFFERFQEFPGKCKCEKEKGKSTCTSYLTKMFVLNNIIYKACLSAPSFDVLNRMLRLEDYVKKIDSESFFFFDKQNGYIDVAWTVQYMIIYLM